jgi:hypothetical protein
MNSEVSATGREGNPRTPWYTHRITCDVRGCVRPKPGTMVRLVYGAGKLSPIYAGAGVPVTLLTGRADG